MAAHNRKYPAYKMPEAQLLRMQGWSFRALEMILGVPFTTVAKMAQGKWGGKGSVRVPCKYGCGKSLRRKFVRNSTGGAACKECSAKYRSEIRSAAHKYARRYFAMRDLFGFTDDEFEEFMKKCRWESRHGDDVVVNVIVQELVEERGHNGKRSARLRRA